jgi:hypothetical protein
VDKKYDAVQYDMEGNVVAYWDFSRPLAIEPHFYVKKPWQFLTEEEEADLFARYGEDCKAYIQARESVLRRKNT